MSIVTETVDVSTPAGPMAAVVSRPDDNESHPGIIVIQWTKTLVFFDRHLKGAVSAR